MLTIRKSDARGKADFGWLDSRHSFSFGEYHDPAHMGFGSLRVINEDKVAPGRGFGMHAHKNMEIISYVLDGALEHKDSIGTGSIIRPGDLQRMTAGAGIQHSEFNPSAANPVHFLQIWLLPERDGLPPSYEQKTFAAAQKRDRLLLIASGDARDGSVKVHQDADMYASVLIAGQSVSHRAKSDRKVWVQVARGAVSVNGSGLLQGDAAAITSATDVTISGTAQDSEVLLFDLA